MALLGFIHGLGDIWIHIGFLLMKHKRCTIPCKLQRYWGVAALVELGQCCPSAGGRSGPGAGKHGRKKGAKHHMLLPLHPTTGGHLMKSMRRTRTAGDVIQCIENTACEKRLKEFCLFESRGE